MAAYNIYLKDTRMYIKELTRAKKVEVEQLNSNAPNKPMHTLVEGD